MFIMLQHVSALIKLSLAIVKILKEGVFQSNTIKFNMIEISTLRYCVCHKI